MNKEIHEKRADHYHAARAESPDVLGHTAQLTEKLTVWLLGVPILFETNSTRVLDIIKKTFLLWDAYETDTPADAPRPRARIIVHTDGNRRVTDDHLSYRLFGDRLIGAGGGVMFTAGRSEKSALAFVDPFLVSRGRHFRKNVLECLALYLATTEDRVPIHASALVKDGVALLLSGPAGIGKSTLSYALFKNGWSMLAEDAVYVSLSNGLQLWGHPGTILLPPESKDFFPELAGLKAQIQPNGKNKVSIDLLAGKWGDRLKTRFKGDIRVILLEKTADNAHIYTIDAENLKKTMLSDVEPGFDISNDLESAVNALADCKSFKLGVCRRLDENLDCLTGAV